jgi:hypothetical protein
MTPVMAPGSLPSRIRYGTTDMMKPAMNIMGSQHVKSHIRADRRNNMLYSMMEAGPDSTGTAY